MMPAHGRLSIPEMTHHESRIKEEEEDSISVDTPTTPTSQGKIESLLCISQLIKIKFMIFQVYQRALHYRVQIQRVLNVYQKEAISKTGFGLSSSAQIACPLVYLKGNYKQQNPADSRQSMTDTDFPRGRKLENLLH